MKKTFTANLNGTVFHIEEDAYDQLQRYLANIRAKFSGSSEAEEIMADIEARIAELFTERLQGRQAVNMGDVDHVKQVMGQPEDYVDGEPADDGPGTHEQAHRQYGPHRHKRLFRDPDDRWVGGVISGLAHYFGTDPLWFRIAFVIIVLAGWGSPILIYLLMWALVPEASTAAEKLEMQGEAVTVDNIKRMFDEGTERFKAGAAKVAGEAREMGRNYWRHGSSYGHHARYRAEGVAFRIFDVFGKLVGVVLFLIAIVLGLSLITAFVTGTASWTAGGFDGGTGMMGIAGFILPGMGHSVLFLLALTVLLLIPVILLLLAALGLMFRVRTPRWAGWMLSVLFILALVAVCWIGIGLARDFRHNGVVLSGVEIPAPANGVLDVSATGPHFADRTFRFHNMVAHFDADLVDFEGDSARVSLVGLRVEQSSDSAFHLVTARIARGASGQLAQLRASHINTAYAWKDGVLRISDRYTMPTRDLMRAQHVRYVLQVPIGGNVHFEPSCAALMQDWSDSDIDGFELDRDMAGHTWTMTADGLQKVNPPAPNGSTPMPKGGKSAPQADGSPNVQAAFEMPNLFDLLTQGLKP